MACWLSRFSSFADTTVFAPPINMPFLPNYSSNNRILVEGWSFIILHIIGQHPFLGPNLMWEFKLHAETWKGVNRFDLYMKIKLSSDWQSTSIKYNLMHSLVSFSSLSEVGSSEFLHHGTHSMELRSVIQYLNTEVKKWTKMFFISFSISKHSEPYWNHPNNLNRQLFNLETWLTHIVSIDILKRTLQSCWEKEGRKWSGHQKQWCVSFGAVGMV